MTGKSLRECRNSGAAKRAIALSFRERPKGRAKNLAHGRESGARPAAARCRQGQQGVRRFLACARNDRMRNDNPRGKVYLNVHLIVIPRGGHSPAKALPQRGGPEALVQSGAAGNINGHPQRFDEENVDKPRFYGL